MSSVVCESCQSSTSPRPLPPRRAVTRRAHPRHVLSSPSAHRADAVRDTSLPLRFVLNVVCFAFLFLCLHRTPGVPRAPVSKAHAICCSVCVRRGYVTVNLANETRFPGAAKLRVLAIPSLSGPWSCPCLLARPLPASSSHRIAAWLADCPPVVLSTSHQGPDFQVPVCRAEEYFPSRVNPRH